MADLTRSDIQVLEMLGGRREGEWGAWVGACLGELRARGFCTPGPNYRITPAGRAHLDALASKEPEAAHA